jgi:hypothetical protein
MWNVALTDADAAMLALGFSPLLIKPEGLVSYIPLLTTSYRDFTSGIALTASGAGVVVYSHPRVLYGIKPRIFFDDVAVPVPNDPTLLTATAFSSTRIDLAWTDNGGAETGFRIYRSVDGVNYTELDTVLADVVVYSDTACVFSTQYWYKVTAYNIGGESGYSNVADATTPPDSNAVKLYKPLIWNGAVIAQSDIRYIALVDGAPEPDTVLGISWIYVDEDDGYLKIKFGDGTVQTIAGCTVRYVTADYVVLSNDDVIVCNKTTAILITLPAASGSGKRVTIKNIGVGSATLDGDGSDTIDGEITQTLTQYESLQVVDYAANKWAIL